MTRLERSGRPQKASMLSVLKQMLSSNGLLWTLHVVPYVLVRKVFKDCRLPFLDRRIKHLEAKYHLPGMHSAKLNRLIWDAWNWEKDAGDEWTYSDEWKQSLIDNVLLKYIEKGSSILEIGPGGGRWSETLQSIASDLTLVDISDKCIQVCKQRFSHCNNVAYHVTEGSNLDFIGDQSIDFIWSYDVFVHIAPEDTDHYLKEFSRVLKNGGRGIIHHPKEGGLHGGWRSSMTDELFVRLLSRNNLSLVTQFDSWGEDERFNVRYYHDTFTIFEK